MTATLKVCLWKSATPRRINPKIMNSTLTGPIEGTAPVAADEITGISNRMEKNSTLFEFFKKNVNKLVFIRLKLNLVVILFDLIILISFLSFILDGSNYKAGIHFFLSRQYNPIWVIFHSSNALFFMFLTIKSFIPDRTADLFLSYCQPH